MRDRSMQALAGIVAAAAALRFATLDVQSYWSDEAVTVLLLGQSLPDLVGDIPDSESTPPLYYVLAWLWSKLFGTGEVGLRSLSALFGTLTVPAAFVAARDLVSKRAGLVAAALVAANPLLVWYSQEARAYALLVLLAALTLVFFARALDGRRGALAGWAIVSALALATHYFALFVVVPEALWLLWRVRPRRAAAWAIGGPGVTGLALLPLALHQRSNERAEFIEFSDLGFRLAQVPKQFLVAFDAPAEVAVTALAAALAALGLGLLALKTGRAGRRGAAIAAAVGALAIAIPVVLAAAGADFVLTRNLIGALVPLLVALAAGLAAHRAGLGAAAALCVLWAGLVVWTAAEPESHRQNWRGAAKALGRATVDRAIVVTPINGREPLEVYLPEGDPVRFDEVRQVREVAYVGIARRAPGQDELAPLAIPPGAPNLAGFELVEHVEGQGFAAYRYRGPQPQPAAPDAISAFKLEPAIPLVLFQPAEP